MCCTRRHILVFHWLISGGKNADDMVNNKTNPQKVVEKMIRKLLEW